MQGVRRPWERTHDFVTNGFDDGATVAESDLRQRIQYLGSQRARFDVTTGFE